MAKKASNVQTKKPQKPVTRKQKPAADVFKYTSGQHNFVVQFGYIQISYYSGEKIHGDLITSSGEQGGFNSIDLGNLDKVMTRSGSATMSSEVKYNYLVIRITPNDLATGMKCRIAFNDQKQRILICE